MIRFGPDFLFEVTFFTESRWDMALALLLVLVLLFKKGRIPALRVITFKLLGVCFTSHQEYALQVICTNIRGWQYLPICAAPILLFDEKPLIYESSSSSQEVIFTNRRGRQHLLIDTAPILIFDEATLIYQSFLFQWQKPLFYESLLKWLVE